MKGIQISFLLNPLVLNMILILSSAGDLETDNICGCLKQKKIEYLRINDTDFLLGRMSIELSNDGFMFLFNNELIVIEKATCIWIRKRGFFQDNPLLVKFNKIEISDIRSFMKREFETIHNFLIGFFDQKLFFNDKSLLNINKLTILRYAKEEGLNIPSTFLTTKKEELNAFQKKGNFNKLLIKPISNNIGLQYNDENCITPNFLLETKEKAYMPDSFFISQFQNYIGKQIEIRAFYLDENIYAMAIFSQQDEKTKIDFRNYNLENPNRTAAFKLPKELTRKLTSLMKKINANAGSIDLILSPDNKYYFLEINPFGIFSMIEDVCNYGLYELVADSLINHSDHVKKNNK